MNKGNYFLVVCSVLLGFFQMESKALNCPSGETEYQSSKSSLTIGGVDFTFTAPNKCGTSPYDFSVSDLSATLDLPAPFNDESVDLTSVTIQWDETDAGVVSNEEFSWTGDKVLITLQGIEFSITEASFSVASSSGTITLNAEVKEEVSLKDIIYIQPDDLGDVTITFDGSGTFDFDYSGLMGPDLWLKANDGTILVELTVPSITKAGLMKDVNLVIPDGSDVAYESAGFTAALKSLDMTFDYDIPSKDLTYKDGSGEMLLKDVTGIAEDIAVTLTLSENDASAALTVDECVKAFGFEMEGAITFRFAYDFELTSIIGTGLQISRNDQINISLSAVNFVISNGELETFTASSTTAGYGGFLFDLTNIEYSSGALSLSATLSMPNGDMTVNGFSIATSGTVGLDSVKINFTEAPLIVRGDADFQGTQFSASLEAEFASAAIQAEMVVGRTSFNYVYGKLVLEGNFATIPGTPLKISQLGGWGGYNYHVDTSGEGSPSLGQHLVGFSLGISDISDNFKLVGGTTISFGSNGTAFNINGAVMAPATAPHYFSGTASVDYQLGSGVVSGDITTSVSVPPSSGDVVYINSEGIDYRFDQAGWRVGSTEAIKGEILGQIEFSALFRVSGTFDSGINHALVMGNLAYDFNGYSQYPEDFDPTAEDQSWGFGYYGELEVNMDGSLLTEFNDAGINGTISANIGCYADLTVHWPDLTFWNDDHGTKTYNILVEGGGNISKANDSLLLEGSAKFSYNGEEKSGVGVKIYF